ncbi:hypothetical protein PUR71_22495 [Streptomyces sp. SP17BM10]|uniref:hypothetical protein n=1 Tax=Streptomyces sp. SP17BM10 TaxID=3002530 RepID=UPI002E776D71|nr:hypothetical protein [Streptomyces sp. SP17BM10]MEE1785653.1 hypothetical protein [Streptomyces sp. SP17BM10]
MLIVEPGAFRTGFAGGGALAHATPIAAYDHGLRRPRNLGKTYKEAVLESVPYGL